MFHTTPLNIINLLVRVFSAPIKLRSMHMHNMRLIRNALCKPFSAIRRLTCQTPKEGGRPMRAKLIKIGIITTALLMMFVGNSGAKEQKKHFRPKNHHITRVYKWSNYPIYRHKKHYRSLRPRPYFKHRYKHRHPWRNHRHHNYDRHHHYYFGLRGYRRHH